MSADAGFYFSGAWLLGLGPDALRSLSRRVEESRDEIPEGRYRLRSFASGIQILGDRPGVTLPLPLLHAITTELRAELKLLWTARVKHRGSEFFDCQYEHWRGSTCLRRLSTAPILGDSIGWVAADGSPELWETTAFTRPPQKGQATHAMGWERLYELATSGQGPVPLGSGPPQGEAEIFGVQPRVRLG